MSRSSSSRADELASRLQAFERTRRKVELLRSRGDLGIQACEHMYEALFLNVYVSFEAFVEDLFVGLLVEKRGLESARADVVPRVSVRSFTVARELIAGPSKAYRDWMPYRRTEEIAQILFRAGRPFTDLEQPEKDVLTRAAAIRNAIAHKSRYAMSKFERTVIGTTPVTTRERRPAGYLRGRFRISPPQTRYENLAAGILLIGRKLAK